MDRLLIQSLHGYRSVKVEEESSRTSGGRGNLPGRQNDQNDSALPVGEIISLEQTSHEDLEVGLPRLLLFLFMNDVVCLQTREGDDLFEGAEAEEATDFKPSNPAPTFVNGPQLVRAKAVPTNTLSLDQDSNFGVAVTPIQVGTVRWVNLSIETATFFFNSISERLKARSGPHRPSSHSAYCTATPSQG